MVQWVVTVTAEDLMLRVEAVVFEHTERNSERLAKDFFICASTECRGSASSDKTKRCHGKNDKGEARKKIILTQR